MAEVDLVVHAAGPFQRRTNCNVLEAALATKVQPLPCSSLSSLKSLFIFLKQVVPIRKLCILTVLW